TIDHLEFSGAKVVDGNGAGIRYQSGHLTVLDSYFHDNQEGILGGAVASGRVDIRKSEFAHNGAGDGYTHGIYIGDIAALTVTGSYFHDTLVGHQIKSRAEHNTIIGNVIDDGAGTSSYSIDLPNGGVDVVRDNTIVQGPNGENNAIIHFGGEGGAPY